MKSLLIDIGNTNIHLGLTEKKKILLTRKIDCKNSIQSLSEIIKKHKPTEAFVCSVVPNLSLKVREVLKKNRIEVYECGKEIKIPVKNLYKKPRQVGQDRLINVYATNNLYKDVRLVIDLGTALTFDFISERGEYLGGLIFPGINISLSGLLNKCALLPKKLRLKFRPTLYGKSTSECISSGVIFGYSFLIGGLVEHLKKNKKFPFKSILTGGDCKFIIKNIAKVDYIDSNLSLKGLNILRYKKI